MTEEKKVTPEEAAKQYVETHTDSEIRRMYGHHYRSFLAGTKYADKQKADLLEALKKLIPLAEDGYKLHVKNCSHQEFLNDDRDDIAFAKEQIQKAEQL
jgi:hypothetical protein